MVRINKLGSKNVEVIKKVRQNRDNIKTVLHEVRLKIANLQQVQFQLDKMEVLLKQGESDQSKYKDYTKKEIITEKILVDAPYHSTICENCNYVCHDNCSLQEISELGSNQFKNCAAFSGDYCKDCPGKCLYTRHYHAKKTVKTIEKTVEKMLQDIKAKFDSANNKVSDAKSQLKVISSSRDDVNKKIEVEISRLDNSCKEIMTHCTGFNLAAELNNTMQQLTVERSMMSNLAAMATADKFINTIKQIIDGLTEKSKIAINNYNKNNNIDKSKNNHKNNNNFDSNSFNYKRNNNNNNNNNYSLSSNQNNNNYNHSFSINSIYKIDENPCCKVPPPPVPQKKKK
jgi:hypothetical protein